MYEVDLSSFAASIPVAMSVDVTMSEDTPFSHVAPAHVAPAQVVVSRTVSRTARPS